MKALTLWGRALFSLSLVGALLYFVDWRQSLTLLRQIDPLPLLLALPLFPLGLWISAEKWRLLLLVHQLRIGSWQLLQWYWIGAFLSNFLPSSIGGDVSRLAFTRHMGRMAEVAASIVMERLTGFGVLLAFSTLSLILGGGYLQEPGLEPLLWLLVAGSAVVLGLTVCCGNHLAGLVNGLCAGRQGLLFRWLAKGNKVAQALAFYRGYGRITVICLLLSLLFYVLTIIAHYLFFHSLDIPISLAGVFLIVPLITLISALPISVNSLGLAEGAYVLLFTQVGIPPEECFAVALLIRFVQLLLTSLGGILLLIAKRKRLKSI